MATVGHSCPSFGSSFWRFRQNTNFNLPQCTRACVHIRRIYIRVRDACMCASVCKSVYHISIDEHNVSSFMRIECSKPACQPAKHEWGNVTIFLVDAVAEIVFMQDTQGAHAEHAHCKHTNIVHTAATGICYPSRGSILNIQKQTDDVARARHFRKTWIHILAIRI